ncbi:MAG: hypothetical protein QXV17_07325 [Candidatus Micrarchaeaceae archaeon]
MPYEFVQDINVDDYVLEMVTRFSVDGKYLGVDFIVIWVRKKEIEGYR